MRVWIGRLATTLFLFSAVLPALDAIIRHETPIPWYLLGVWGLGEICAFIYAWPTRDKILLGNYLGNFICLLIIAVYKFILS